MSASDHLIAPDARAMLQVMDDETLTSWIRKATGSAATGMLTATELNAVVSSVGKLSERLNHERTIVRERYLDDPELLAGYVAFFLPRSIHQIGSILAELDRPPRRVLDVGCGPGSATLAAIEAGAETVCALDHSSRALQIVESLSPVDVATQRVDLERHDIAHTISSMKADTVIASHVVNELWTDENELQFRVKWCRSILEALPPSGRFILIDPALKETSRELAKLRDALIEAGGRVLAPCLRQADCPALHDERDWCHTERIWTPPPLVELLAERVGVRADVAKMSYFVFGEQAPRNPENRYRIVSEPLHTKGRLRYFGCGPAGRRPLVLKERDALGDAAVFAELVRGDIVEIGETIEKGDGFVVQKSERVRRIAQVGEPWPSSDS